MKKAIACILALLLILSGCETQPLDHPTEATLPSITPPETQAPTVVTDPTETEPPETDPVITEPPAPETEEAAVLADGTVLLLETLPMGTTVEILDSYDDNYYIVKLQQSAGFAGLIEKRLVRLENEEAYTAWKGYARYGAGFYTNYLLLPDGMQQLSTNQTVEVLDSLGDVLVVRLGDTVGYMNQKSLSASYIPPSSGGNGSDGGDIELRNQGGIVRLGSFFGITNPENAQVTGTGTVKAEGAEVICGWFDKGDTASIVTEETEMPQLEGWCVVYKGGIWGYVRRSLIRMDGQEAYQSWDGYAKYNAAVYGNYYLAGEAEKTLPTNTVVQVLEDLGSSYLVSVGDTLGYMAKDMVSQTKNATGGSSGGEWSDPVM